MLKTATVICAKCNRTGKLFGIRTEKKNTGWMFTWAFPLSQESAANEGYDKTIINNSFVRLELPLGSKDLSIQGITEFGEIIDIMEDGIILF